MQVAARAKAAGEAKAEDDPLQHKYGDLPLIQSQEQTGRVWTEICKLDKSLEGQTVSSDQSRRRPSKLPEQIRSRCTGDRVERPEQMYS